MTTEAHNPVLIHAGTESVSYKNKLHFFLLLQEVDKQNSLMCLRLHFHKRYSWMRCSVHLGKQVTFAGETLSDNYCITSVSCAWRFNWYEKNSFINAFALFSGWITQKWLFGGFEEKKKMFLMVTLGSGEH